MSKKKSGPIIGASFSPWHASWLHDQFGGPSWEESLEGTLKLGIKRIRLCVPWNAIAPQQDGELSLDWVIQALDICRKNQAQVILTLGIKTPHWPEFHTPSWLKIPDHGLIGSDKRVASALSDYVARMVHFFSDPPFDKVVDGFQIENEPLMASRSISRALLKQEIEQVRSIDPRSILLTSWTAVDAPRTVGPAKESKAIDQFKEEVEQAYQPMRLFLGLDPIEILEPGQRLLAELGFGAKLEQLVSMADLLKWGDWIGLDVYAKAHHFETSEAQFQLIRQAGQRIKQAGKRFIVAELQAEPWEEDPKKMDLHDPNNNMSLNPVEYRKLFDRVKSWQPDEIWLWGLEFQLACRKQGNSAWIEETKRILAQHPVK